MMSLGHVEGVIEGYAAFNIIPDGWKGVVAGNRFCDHYRKTSDDALQDAKEMFEHLYSGV